MKKITKLLIFTFLFIIMGFNTVKAEINLTHECEQEVAQGDGTFLKVCNLKFNVINESYDIEKISLNISYENINVESLTVSVPNDWNYIKNSNNNIIFWGSNNNFTSGNTYEYGTLRLIYNKINYLENCRITLNPNINIDNRSCSYNSELNAYFDLYGNKTTETLYRQQCMPHSCEKVGDKYYNSVGTEVTEEEYKLSCFKCKYENNKYYDNLGNETTKEIYQDTCEFHSCVYLNGKYYNENGEVVTEEVYKNSCEKKTHKCEIVDTKYYDNKGNVVSKEEYDKMCGELDNNPKTGLQIGIFTLIIMGTSFGFAYHYVNKKNRII